MTTILVAEDEARIAAFLDKGLRAAGFQTVVVGDGRQALSAALAGSHDLLLLDVGLPSMDGFEVLRRVRSVDTELPIIMLTARSSGPDTLTGLTEGADDYVPKPFKFDELLARIRLRMRRMDATAASTTVTYEGIVLDLRTRRVTVDGRQLELSAREFALAEELLRHPDQVLSREQLLSRVWGFDFDPGSNIVDVYVRYLRAKLGADRIETVRGMGYRLV
jgi:two-component system, OmpR family, copper resistance phosphate regulon response regulator CusR